MSSTRSHDSSIPYQANCGRQTNPKRKVGTLAYAKHDSVYSLSRSSFADSTTPQNHLSTITNTAMRCPFLVSNMFIHNIYMVLCRRPTLIFGEPGLEKDNIAAQIHHRSSKHQEWPIARFDGSKLDSYGSQLFGRGSKQGLLHWVGQGTLLLTNVHKVSPTCWSGTTELSCCRRRCMHLLLTLQTSALAV